MEKEWGVSVYGPRIPTPKRSALIRETDLRLGAFEFERTVVQHGDCDGVL